ncbi:hypothetical protein ACIBH1_17265 [Nonomuraea sp. NPDC050663]|uniref:hypothetical protein n=1 Tax=Nonomuraea sp. NPDC050663 TaxID=3364370 RepID=UPI00378792FC
MSEPFDVIEAGSKDRRRRLGAGLLLALAVIVVIGLLSTRGSGPPEPKASPTPTPTAVVTTPNVISPVARRDGDDEVIDVVFPDGTAAEVRYPRQLGLAAMGVRPMLGGWLDGEMTMYRQLVAPYAGQAEVSRGGQALRNLTDNVTLWPRQPGGGSGQVLLFAFGDWRLALYDRSQGLTFEQRMTWARNLTGKVTDDGFLVLSAKEPLRLAEPGESGWSREPAGPQLWFGPPEGPTVVLVPTPVCRANPRPPSALIQSRGRFTYLCRDGLSIGASGTGDWVTQAIEGIRVRLK